MKTLLNSLLFLVGASTTVFAQCDLNASATSTTIVCGESVTLSAYGSSTGQLVLDEDFNTGGFGAGWSGTPGATSFSNPCSPGGVDGTPHAWMDNNTTVPRTLTSASYDLSAATAGVTICFDMLFASQGDPAPCEGPDEPDEGVYLQYSIDGGTNWIDIFYFDPNGGNDPQLTNWNNWCFAVPGAAITTNTMFRWHQTADSGADYDHWGIDNVQIFMNDINSEITWLHDGYSYGIGSGGGDNPTPVTPTSTTTYTAMMVTGTLDTCYADVTVNVVAPNYNVNVTAAPNPICVGSCATISGTAEIIEDPGGIETYENAEVALISGTPGLPGLPPIIPPTPGDITADMNINVVGINQPTVTSGLITTVCINGFNIIPLGGGTVSLADVTIVLTCPSGTSITLVNPGEMSGTNITNMCFQMGGPAVTTGSAPYSGTFAPAQSFDLLNGCDAEGVWNLTISGPINDFSIPLGSISGWSITFDDPPVYQPVCASWSPAAGLSNPASINTDACPGATTNYTLTVSNCVPGCPTYTEDFNIIVNPCGGCIPPNVNIVSPLTACAPATVDLANAIGVGSDPATISYHNSQADAQNDVNPIGQIVAASGSYWIRAEDPLDPTCFMEYEVVVTINDISYNVSISDETCGAGDGQISLTANLGSGTYTYSIDGGTTSQGTGTFTNLSANTYSILITDVTTGCTVTGTETVGNLGGPSIDNMVTIDPSCPGVCDGQITVNVSGGAPPYSYQWYDGTGAPIGGNTATITGLCAGNYSVDVTDAAGGTSQLFYDDFETGAAGWNLNATMAVEGTDPNFFQVDDDESGVAVGGCGTFGTGDETLHITSVFNPAGGAAYDAGGLCPFLFCPETHRQAETPLINTVGQTGLTLNFDYIAGGDAPNDQATVWYNDGLGWTQLGGTLFSGTGICAPQGIWTAYSSALPASCENIANLQIAIRWDNNDDAAGSDPSVAINNIEVVTASGAVCTSTDFATLVDPAAADATFALTDFCEGTTNGATGIVTPGGTFAYNPNPGDGSTVNPATGEITNGVGGTQYFIEYTTPGPCPVSSIESVNVNPLPTPVITGVLTYCTGSNATLDAGPGYTAYNWSTGDNTQTITALAQIGVTVTVTDVNGCVGTSNPVDIVESVAIISNTIVSICAGGSATIHGNTETVAGTYSQTYTAQSGCDSISNVDLIVNALPTPVIAGNLTYCTGGNVTLDAGGPYTSYNWSTGGVNQTETTTAGTGITVTVQDANGCSGTSAPVDVVEVSTVVYDSLITICDGESAMIFGNSETVAGVYSQLDVSVNGCDSTTNITLVVNQNPVIDIMTITEELCLGDNDASIDVASVINGSGVYSYSWNIVPNPATSSVTNLSPGSYTVTVTDDNTSCFDDSTVTVNAGPLCCDLVIDTIGTTPPGCGQADGIIDMSATGGTGTYFYSINGGAFGAATSFTGLAVGLYQIIVQDDLGLCADTIDVQLNNPNSPTIDNLSSTDVLCHGGSDGTITITASGGTGALDFEISLGAFVDNNATGQFTGLVAGTYNVTVTDINGCQATDVIQINEPTEVTAAVQSIDVSCFGLLDGSITVVGNGGVGPYNYSIDNGVTWVANGSFINLAAGAYDVIVEDANGCQSAVTNMNISEPSQVVVNTVVSNETCADMCDGEVDWSISAGTAPYDFVFDGTLTTSTPITDLCPGSFDYTATDSKGCIVNGTVTIDAAIPITIDTVLITDDGCSENCDGTITIESTTAVNYYIDGTQSASGYFTGICAGSYTVIAEDQNGCTTEGLAIVGTAVQATANFAYTPSHVTQYENEIQLLNSSINAVDYVWEISNGNGFTDVLFGDLEEYTLPTTPDSYTICLIAISESGCQDTMCAPLLVQEEITLYIPNTFTPDGDEFNQNLVVYANGIDDYAFEMRIFNRWGQIVFESFDKTISWDGTYNGKMVQDGTYIWVVVLKDPHTDEHIEFNGHVSVMR